jgi:hypothetical protein
VPDLSRVFDPKVRLYGAKGTTLWGERYAFMGRKVRLYGAKGTTLWGAPDIMAKGTLLWGDDVDNFWARIRFAFFVPIDIIPLLPLAVSDGVPKIDKL